VPVTNLYPVLNFSRIAAKMEQLSLLAEKLPNTKLKNQ
jgi:hypothetical protein